MRTSLAIAARNRPDRTVARHEFPRQLSRADEAVEQRLRAEQTVDDARRFALDLIEALRANLAERGEQFAVDAADPNSAA